MYVLVFKEKSAKNKYYTGHNLYLGLADLTLDINDAENMSLEEAERKYNLMKDKEKWHIHPIIFCKGIGQEYTDHVVKNRIKDLKNQIKKEEEKLR